MATGHEGICQVVQVFFTFPQHIASFREPSVQLSES